MTAVDPSHVMTLRTLVSHPARWATSHAVTRGSWTAIPSWPATSWVTAPNARAASAPTEAVNVSQNPRGVRGARRRLPHATCRGNWRLTHASGPGAESEPFGREPAAGSIMPVRRWPPRQPGQHWETASIRSAGYRR